MFESALYYSSKSQKPLSFDKLKISKFILATIHRAESTNDINVLKNIINAFNEIHKSVPLVIPLHPRTLNILQQNKIKTSFHIIEPVGYLQMIWLLQNSSLVITDSGGLQKEAFFFNKICLTIRNETEWLELLSTKNNILVGTETKNILDKFNSNPIFIPSNESIFGNGNTSEIIINNLN